MLSTQTPLVSVEEAIGHILERVTPMQALESVSIEQSLQRILGEDLQSALALPPFDNSAMDGYALRASDLTDSNMTLRLMDTAFAGHPAKSPVTPGTCIRIMTGAMLPIGADTVIMQEQTEADGTSIHFSKIPSLGANVRRAGEDVAKGAVILTKGTAITPAIIGLMASMGVATCNVIAKPKVAIFSTGDELKSLGEPLAPGQIYDSNRYAMKSMLERTGVEVIDLGILADDAALIESTILDAVAQADLLLTSGGVSVGDADFVAQTLDRLGNIDFWRIAMKPGKPLAFGKIKNCLFFGLPGNPVSVMATYYQFVRVALAKLMGKNNCDSYRFPVPCGHALKKDPGRTDFQRGILQQNEQGQWQVYSAGLQGSHVLSSMVAANCFIILPRESGDIEAGALVEVEPFYALV